MNKRWIAAACSGLLLSIGTAAIAAPAKKPVAKKPAVKKPVAAKKPPTSQGGATQITAIEGEVGKDYINRVYRIKFALPTPKLVFNETGAGADKYWLVFPFTVSNATKDEKGFWLDRVDLADAQAHVIEQSYRPSTINMLPAAHGKGEVGFIVPKDFKPIKMVVQPQDGLPLRLMLPKGFTVTPPTAEGKLGEDVSNGAISVSITAPRKADKYKNEELEEGKTWLLVDMVVTNQVAAKTDVWMEEVLIESEDGEQVTPATRPETKTLIPGGKLRYTYGFQVDPEFVPVLFRAVSSYNETIPVTIRLK